MKRSAWLKRGQRYLSTLSTLSTFISAVKTWEQSLSLVASFRSPVRFAGRLHGSGHAEQHNAVPFLLHLSPQRKPSSRLSRQVPELSHPRSWKEGPRGAAAGARWAVARPWGGAALAASGAAAAVPGVALGQRVVCFPVFVARAAMGRWSLLLLPALLAVLISVRGEEGWKRSWSGSGREHSPALSPWGGGRALQLGSTRQ